MTVAGLVLGGGKARAAVLPVFLFLVSAFYSRGEVVDQIVAVVGREAITQTELESQLLLYETQLGPSERGGETEKLRKEILNTMIENRILLAQAEKETLEVKREEVESALENAIGQMRERFPSEEEFQAQLDKEQMTIEGLKQRHREEMRKSLLVQKLIQKRLAPKVLVTHLDVERFYEENPDSIPKQPATVRLAHILILLLPSEGAEKRAQEELEEIVAAIDAGVGWDYLAEKHSDDRGTKYGGGDLGYFKRGEMVPEFEEAAFSLKVGEITAVRSRLGYHLVKCEAKRNEEVRARHILLKVVPSRSDTLRARSIAEEAKKRAISGEDFSALVSEYSQDQASREKKGELGAFAVEDLPSPLDEAVRGVEPGGIGGPILSEFGYHVVKVLDKKEARTPTFEEIKDRLKTYLTQRQMEEEYRKWIERLREEVYIESRL